ncbi:MAG: type II toxin-antitoxin system PemK/MazF family toxin [Alphaproteobacteria bacterium]|nr:type II toxin-antitoxin system PemK/MazF family toxin [Alphaproteobacteria bacterium]MBU6471296.1 type II toxin-antitoxin system PemK/MazF family toxin [Alphaproteobacteria bacterium]MDE2109755.1 type II toxin-antitoxin system PemK/MazF family toxin [Alphaproteobacteria bacterium]MDE2494379.1 type II toxin-antitoxin system PemK/MazF family toxin [Alphaproteobacteria bacterium]
MKRGAIWTAAGGPDYISKPRPVVIVQADEFSSLDSITVCPFTRDAGDWPLFRLVIEPAKENGLAATSRLMVDKITTLPKTKLGRRIGALSRVDMIRLERAAVVFLGLGG